MIKKPKPRKSKPTKSKPRKSKPTKSKPTKSKPTKSKVKSKPRKSKVKSKPRKSKAKSKSKPRKSKAKSKSKPKGKPKGKLYMISPQINLPNLPDDILKKIFLEVPNTLRMPIAKTYILSVIQIQNELIKKFKKIKLKTVTEIIVEYVPSKYILKGITGPSLLDLFFIMLKDARKNVLEFVLEKRLLSEYDIQDYLGDEDWQAYNISESQLKNMLSYLTRKNERDHLIFFISNEIMDEYPESNKDNLIDKLIDFGYMDENDVYNIIKKVKDRKVLIDMLKGFDDFN